VAYLEYCLAQVEIVVLRLELLKALMGSEFDALEEITIADTTAQSCCKIL
jgi:hypothetical protein